MAMVIGFEQRSSQSSVLDRTRGGSSGTSGTTFPSAATDRGTDGTRGLLDGERTRELQRRSRHQACEFPTFRSPRGRL